MTKLNSKILQMVQESEGHLSAEEAFLLAKKQNINVSMASIYRVLNSLVDKGYLKKISVKGQVDVFDKTTNDHDHLVCKKCGKTTDIVIPEIKDILIKKTGINNIESYELCIDYVCDDCQRKGRKK